MRRLQVGLVLRRIGYRPERKKPMVVSVCDELAEAQFRRVMEDAADRLWELGAAEAAMAALYDVLDEASGGVDWRGGGPPGGGGGGGIKPGGPKKGRGGGGGKGGGLGGGRVFKKKKKKEKSEWV